MFLHLDRDEPDDIDALATLMSEMGDVGRGWVNLMPEGSERAELSATQSVPGMIFGRFSGRGAPTPKVTWTAPEHRRRRTEPAHLGIEHPAGPKAREQLADAGHPVPDGWRVVQDHPLRGLVVQPAGDPTEVVAWALDAAAHLAGGETGRRWVARVFDAPRSE